MTSATFRGLVIASNKVPTEVEELCLVQDDRYARIRASIQSISSELAGPVDREDRFELAAAISDVAGELRGLQNRKLDIGFFEGFSGVDDHLQERVAHLQADYRRLLNELRSAQQESVSGKPRKACRQLNSWLSHFSSLIDREADLIAELWNDPSPGK